MRSILENYRSVDELWVWSIETVSDSEMKARIRGVQAYAGKFIFYMVLCFGKYFCIMVTTWTELYSHPTCLWPKVNLWHTWQLKGWNSFAPKKVKWTHRDELDKYTVDLVSSWDCEIVENTYSMLVTDWGSKACQSSRAQLHQLKQMTPLCHQKDQDWHRLPGHVHGQEVLCPSWTCS